MKLFNCCIVLFLSEEGSHREPTLKIESNHNHLLSLKPEGEPALSKGSCQKCNARADLAL